MKKLFYSLLILLALGSIAGCGTQDGVTITLTPATASVKSGGKTVLLTLTVTDANGNPVSSEAVAFTLRDTSTAGGTFSRDTAITDANGQAETVYVSNLSTSKTGTDTVNATLNSITSVSNSSIITVTNAAIE